MTNALAGICAAAVGLCASAAVCLAQDATTRATSPATAAPSADESATASTAPATATAPVRPKIAWLKEYKAAQAEAVKQKALLVVVYCDPEAPACEVYDEQTLQSRALAEYLQGWVAAQVDVTRGEQKQAFAIPKPDQTPWTLVFSPEGELLDRIVGCITPPQILTARLQNSADYYRAAQVQSRTAEAKWRMVRARLPLSTAAQALPLIDELLKLDPKDLPPQVTPAELHLARGQILTTSDAAAAEASLRKALELTKDQPNEQARALWRLARLAETQRKYAQAVDLLSQLIREAPAAPAVGDAYLTKATLQFGGLKDKPAAIATLQEFRQKYPESPQAKDAAEMLEFMGVPKSAATKPVTQPATGASTRPSGRTATRPAAGPAILPTTGPRPTTQTSTTRGDQ